MKNKYNFILRATHVLMSMLLATSVASAAEVRGRLDHVDSNGAHSPAIGIRVTVYNPASGRSAPATTGSDGIYHIQNIRAGSSQLEVWTSTDPRVPPIAYPIQVAEPYSDIPPIALR